MSPQPKGTTMIDSTSYIIVHTIEGSMQTGLDVFNTIPTPPATTGASAHYIVGICNFVKLEIL